MSHDFGVVKHTCDRFAVMDAGQSGEASTADLYAKPRHLYTEALLSSVPRPDPVRLPPAVRSIRAVRMRKHAVKAMYWCYNQDDGRRVACLRADELTLWEFCNQHKIDTEMAIFCNRKIL